MFKKQSKMALLEFLKTIYVGDRGCKSLIIDTWNREVKIQLTCISRVRSKAWDYYDAEDLPNGFIVFEDVNSIVINPPGAMPNDTINDIRTEAIPDRPGKYLVIVNVDSINEYGIRTEVDIQISAGSMALEAYGAAAKRITQ
ncbi:DUF6258 family protein [Noviherbaspirillum sp. Root189]|uniref:DUF6258 family protein n=1 Tax=Noviherbaspirillum sp. Root189 TaxID=1736487 RepID=UPI00071554BA|nr:DUF6258 family protein [Noviherbaspirillum sp. Root189]KRB76830.1 hypothetical protein ASE07_26370 [Noviherbaspirillum sp. Root189]